MVLNGKSSIQTIGFSVSGEKNWPCISLLRIVYKTKGKYLYTVFTNTFLDLEESYLLLSLNSQTFLPLRQVFFRVSKDWGSVTLNTSIRVCPNEGKVVFHGTILGWVVVAFPVLGVSYRVLSSRRTCGLWVSPRTPVVLRLTKEPPRTPRL